MKYIIMCGGRYGEWETPRHLIEINGEPLVIFNADPHLVDHVDWLIGGSTINQGRGFVARSCRWRDEDLVIQLQNEMVRRRTKS